MSRYSSAAIPVNNFFLSKELSTCPEIADLSTFFYLLHKSCSDKNNKITISVSYGKRMVINADNIDISKLSQEDFVEIVDYDLLKRTLLIIGKKLPSSSAPLHWMVQKARKDIYAIVQLHDKKIVDRLKDDLPFIHTTHASDTFEFLKEVLINLRGRNHVLFQDDSGFFTGTHLNDIKNYLREIGAIHESQR